MEERQQKLEETVLGSSADLAKKIEDSTVALMKRIETVEEEQLTIRHDFEEHVEEINSVVNIFREDVAEQIREGIVEFERRKQRQNKCHKNWKAKAGNSKMRPVLVSTERLRDKREVLNASKEKLKKIPEYSKITVKPDLTRKQREEWQQRRSGKPATNGEGSGSSETPAGRSVLAPKRKIRTNVAVLKLCKEVSNNYKQFILCGDFTSADINWCNNVCTGPVDGVSKVFWITSDPPLGASDHNMIRAEVVLRYFKEDCEKKIKLYSRGDYESISNHLSLLKLESLEGKTVEDMWLIIKSNLMKSIDK
ncbi:unnamed protein product [Allacma fusca]|uniref:Uncharacterized protein n=1 Tax=Allacma fusca TaxID=39272 RepID=A0A8J2L4P7_9HEXA|nr:unnamed protein product [Allacma fusca]